jgi:hypothetical protein
MPGLIPIVEVTDRKTIATEAVAAMLAAHATCRRLSPPARPEDLV